MTEANVKYLCYWPRKSGDYFPPNILCETFPRCATLGTVPIRISRIGPNIRPLMHIAVSIKATSMPRSLIHLSNR